MTAGDKLAIAGLVAAMLWLLAALFTANHGESLGFAFGPLFVCTLFLGFPIVLLAITIAARLRPTITAADLAPLRDSVDELNDRLIAAPILASRTPTES